MEAFTSAIIQSIVKSHEIDLTKLKDNYISRMKKIAEDSIITGINPFSVSTGKIESINNRFEIMEKIVEESLII